MAFQKAHVFRHARCVAFAVLAHEARLAHAPRLEAVLAESARTTAATRLGHLLACSVLEPRALDELLVLATLELRERVVVGALADGHAAGDRIAGEADVARRASATWLHARR